MARWRSAAARYYGEQSYHRSNVPNSAATTPLTYSVAGAGV